MSKHKALYQTILVFLFCFLFCGCGVLSKHRKSFLYGPEVTGKRHQEKIILNDLEIHLYPYNSVQLWSYWSFLLPIIPIYIDTKDHKSNGPFLITLGLLPNKVGFSFEPQKMILSIDGESNILPYKILALPCEKGIREDYISCGPKYIESEPIRINNSLTYQLNKNQWNCYDLYFDIEPPDPSKEISIIIEGVRIEGKPYKIEKFEFHEEHYLEADSAP